MWQRPGPTARQRRIDMWIGLATAAAATLNVAMVRSLGIFVFKSYPSALEQYTWALGITLPLIWRRTHPEIVTLLVAAVFLGGQIRGAQETQFASGVLFAVIYALGAWGRDRVRARWVRAVAIAAMFVFIFVTWFLSFDTLSAARPEARGPVTPLFGALINSLLVNAAIFGFAYLAGETAWLAARRQHQLEVQAEELRAAQAQAQERAVFGERVRIARELHDVVAHHVSVMGIQAAAARRAMDRDAAGKARAALTAVEDSARTAVTELRRMLGALRLEAPAPAAAAGLDRVEELLDRVREAGLTARYTVYGDPVALPDSVSQAAYRIVQEAVTNTLKHARASTVDVRLRYLTGQLEIDVADDGRGAVPAAAGGMGLIGMRERVAVHDGTIETGPRSEGGFRVRARLPLGLIPAQRVAQP